MNLLAMKGDESSVSDDEKQNCFQKRSRLVKCLAVLLIILIIILVALFIQLVVRKDQYVCNSELCIKVSADLMRYINPGVDPCNDYHGFICENFVNDYNELPPVPDENELLEAIITETLNENDPRPFVNQKLFYQSCQDLGAIEVDQDENVMDLFERLGGWPILRGPNWNGSDYYWVDYMIKLRNFGLNFNWFLDFNVYINNTGESYLKIGIPSYLKPVGSDMRHYRKELFTDIAVFMGAPNSIAHYEVSKTIDFEDDLGMLAEKYKYDNVYNESLKISEVQLIWPNIIWLEFINNITKSRLTEHDRIVIGTLEYIQELNRLLMGTPKRIQVDFMLWKLIEEFWPLMSRPIRERFERYKIEILKENLQFDRQKFCVNMSRELFPFVAESVLIRKYLSKEKVDHVKELAFNVQQQFLNHLDRASWMNRELRRRALDKIRNIRFLVGGPEELADEPFFYRRIGIFGFEFQSIKPITMLRERQQRFYEEYYGNIHDRFSRNLEQMEYFRKSINISHFSTVNNNTLIVPVTMLQNLFYHPKLPKYLNYGTLGKEVAKQLFNHFYFSNETSERYVATAFESVTNCLIKESADYIELRDSLRLNEKLADFVAVNIAYEAYTEWARKHSEELLIPGVKYSPRQMFWLHSSKFDCMKISTRQDRELARFKIDEPYRESKFFGDEFNCPAGSRMNPRKKCTVL